MNTENPKDKVKTREKELREMEKSFIKGYLRDLKPPKENK